MGSFVPNDHLKNEPSENNTHSTDHAEMLHKVVEDWMTSPKPGAGDATGTPSPDAAHILGNFHITDDSAPITSKSADAGAEPNTKGVADDKPGARDKELDQLAKGEDLGKWTAPGHGDGAKGEDDDKSLAQLAKPEGAGKVTLDNSGKSVAAEAGSPEGNGRQGAGGQDASAQGERPAHSGPIREDGPLDATVPAPAKAPPQDSSPRESSEPVPAPHGSIPPESSASIAAPSQPSESPNPIVANPDLSRHRSDVAPTPTFSQVEPPSTDNGFSGPYIKLDGPAVPIGKADDGADQSGSKNDFEMWHATGAPKIIYDPTGSK
jgi:hypothetical protein